MDPREILMIVDVVSREKDLEKEIIFQAVEAALATAIRKHQGRDVGRPARADLPTDAAALDRIQAEIDEKRDFGVRVAIHRRNGTHQAFNQWEVVADGAVEFPERQLALADAAKRKPDAAIGDVIEEAIPPVDVGRIATQAAKQVIMQKIREAERFNVVRKFRGRDGDMVSGVVKRLDRGDAIVDIEGAEAILRKSAMIPREGLRPGDRVRAILTEVAPQPRGPVLSLDRVCPEFLIKLFQLEVPEAGDGLIEIRGAARDPGGHRSKIAVHSNDSKVDPVGACVGIQGSRVQSVSGEIAGERVDIVHWSDDPSLFIKRALTPAEVRSLILNEETNEVDVVVEEEQLSRAIGSGGQNVRLASQLTGWEINILTEEEAGKKAETESAEVRERLRRQLTIDEDVAEILVQKGYATPDDIVFGDRADLLAIDEFDEAMVDNICSRAEDALLEQVAADKEKPKPSQELLDLEGMTPRIAGMLTAGGVTDLAALAELAVDELLELCPEIPEADARVFIMLAREPWFADSEEGADGALIDSAARRPSPSTPPPPPAETP